ncbi:MAG: hypothetical protein WBZ36_28540 [Candidatus Nitrosopolaris sp.]
MDMTTGMDTIMNTGPIIDRYQSLVTQVLRQTQISEEDKKTDTIIAELQDAGILISSLLVRADTRIERN